MYQVKFELFGKKMKVNLHANSKQDAEYKLRGKIKIHDISEVKETQNETPPLGKDSLNDLKDFFGFD